jgi:hypothetical protein
MNSSGLATFLQLNFTEFQGPVITFTPLRDDTSVLLDKDFAARAKTQVERGDNDG